MVKALKFTKHLYRKVSQFIDIICVLATIFLLVYWNTPQYQSGHLWIHCHGAYVGDFITSAPTHKEPISNFKRIFCYHSSLIIYINSPEKSVFERFGLYKIKGQ